MKKPAPLARRSSGVAVFIAVSGPKRGRADAEVAFADRRGALDYLRNLHGLDRTEVATLDKTGELDLDRRWHGAERCRLSTVRMAADRARLALSGEAYAA